MNKRLGITLIALGIWILFSLTLFVAVLPESVRLNNSCKQFASKMIRKTVPQQWSLFVPAPEYRKTWRVFYERSGQILDTVFISLNLNGDEKLYFAGLNHLATVQQIKEGFHQSRRIKKDSWYSFYAFRHFAKYYLGEETRIKRTQLLIQGIKGECVLIEEWND